VIRLVVSRCRNGARAGAVTTAWSCARDGGKSWICQVVLAALLFVSSQANAQGLNPNYGADGQVHNRGVPDAVTFAPRRYLVQQYEPPNVPPDIIAPERPRVSPRQSKPAPPIAILPLDPPEPEPTTPAPGPAVPVESMPNPLTEWCSQEANAKAPLCRNIGSPKVQR
jgi:hypothetical protein